MSLMSLFWAKIAYYQLHKRVQQEGSRLYNETLWNEYFKAEYIDICDIFVSKIWSIVVSVEAAPMFQLERKKKSKVRKSTDLRPADRPVGILNLKVFWWKKKTQNPARCREKNLARFVRNSRTELALFSCSCCDSCDHLQLAQSRFKVQWNIHQHIWISNLCSPVVLTALFADWIDELKPSQRLVKHYSWNSLYDGGEKNPNTIGSPQNILCNYCKLNTTREERAEAIASGYIDVSTCEVQR